MKRILSYLLSSLLALAPALAAPQGTVNLASPTGTVSMGGDGTNLLSGEVLCGAASGATLWAVCVNQAYVNSSGQLGIAGPVTVVSGGIASGAIASGAVASGAIASGAFASGAVGSGAFASGSLASGAGTDGWNATEGTKADAAYTTGSGSIVSILKGLFSGIGTLPTGAATAANQTAAHRSEWTAGNGVGLTWTTAFTSTDFTGAQPTTGQTVLSTTSITNGTALDQFMDVSIVQSIASSTIAAGANIAIYLLPLAADGSTYTPALTAGTASSNVLPIPPVCVIPLYVGTTQTVLTGTCAGIIIPPGTFRLAEQNNSGFTYTSTTQVHDYRTYNQNLNN